MHKGFLCSSIYPTIARTSWYCVLHLIFSSFDEGKMWTRRTLTSHFDLRSKSHHTDSLYCLWHEFSVKITFQITLQKHFFTKHTNWFFSPKDLLPFSVIPVTSCAPIHGPDFCTEVNVFWEEKKFLIILILRLPLCIMYQQCSFSRPSHCRAIESGEKYMMYIDRLDYWNSVSTIQLK